MGKKPNQKKGLGIVALLLTLGCVGLIILLGGGTLLIIVGIVVILLMLLVLTAGRSYFKLFACMKSILVLVFLSVTSLATKAQQNYDTLMARGYRAFASGDLDSAGIIAIEASVYYEHLVQPHLFKAEVDFSVLDKAIKKNEKTDSFEAAHYAEWAFGFEAVQKALKIEPMNPLARFYRAWAYMVANNTDSAMADIIIALKAEPANADYLQLKQAITEAPEKIMQKYKTSAAKSRLCVSLGITYSFSNQWISYNYYEEALKHDPRNITALVLQGSTLRTFQYYQHALEKLNAGLKIDSNNTPLIAEKYQVQLQYDPTRTDLKNIPNKSKDEEYRKFKTEMNSVCDNWLTYFSKKQYDSAALLITDCMMSPGTSISASFNNRGVSYYHLKKPDAAINDFKKSILIGGAYNNGHAEYWLARIYFEQGKKQQAENIVKEAITIYPQHKMLAELQKQITGGMPAQQSPVTPANKPATLKQPVTAADFYREALTAINNQDYNKAFICFNTALEIKPGYDSVLFDRGQLYHELMAHSLAVKDFTEVSVLNFTEPKYYLYVAAAQFAQANYQTAITRLNTVLSMDATNGSAYAMRSVSYCKTGNAALAAEDAKKAATYKVTVDDCTQLLNAGNQHMAESKKQSANGIALLAAKKEEEAAAVFKKAIENWSGNQDAYFHLASLYEKYRMGHVAYAYIKQLEYINPNYPGSQKLAISIATLKGLQ